MGRKLAVLFFSGLAPLLVSSPLRAGDGLLPGAKAEDPLTIEANRLDMKDSRKLLVYTGNILVANGPSTLKSSDLTIHLDSAEAGVGSTTDRVNRIEANGPVVINTQKEAYSGNRLQYDRHTNKIYLNGNVTIQQGDGLTRADNLEFDKGNNTALLTGNVVFQKGAAVVKGEKLVYDQARDKIVLNNNVVYISGDTSVTGRKMDFDRKANTALFTGDVVYVKKDTVVRGEAMEYNLTTNQGVVRTGPASTAHASPTGGAAAGQPGNRVKAIFTPGQGKSM
jgi:lipopolysaccharide export system protein LptA